MYHLIDVASELEILKESLKLPKHQRFLALFRNLYGSNQTLQAEVTPFKEGQTRENRFTSNTARTRPRRQQLGPSSKMRASPVSRRAV